jgi:hypothetical protein
MIAAQLPPDMPTAPANVIDALNSLLEAEVNSIFQTVEEGFPYLSRTVAEVRKTIMELADLSRRHAQELASLIDSVGGVALPRHIVNPEGQYLAYLNVKFLLPKLIAEMDLLLQRYSNAGLALEKGHPAVAAELDRIASEKRQYLQALHHAAA